MGSRTGSEPEARQGHGDIRPVMTASSSHRLANENSSPKVRCRETGRGHLIRPNERANR